jgi:excinuclease ABC subunit A
VVEVDAVRVVSSPWSTVATETGVFDLIRDRFAASEEAAARRLRKSDFATAVAGGRCDTCEGVGQVRISMDFLPDVWMTCEACGGRRYGEAVLACRIGGKTIADVFDMTVDEAREFFSDDEAGREHGRRPARKTRLAATDVRGHLSALHEAGLGYVRLGQATRTLSGGERQRLVLTGALRASGSGPAAGPDLYVFDEPTRGLHPADVDRLLGVFDGLIAAGHTLVVVEHNLEVVRHADWVIDLGPEGGDGGGRVVAAGPPQVIESCEASHTGRALRQPDA